MYKLALTIISSAVATFAFGQAKPNESTPVDAASIQIFIKLQSSGILVGDPYHRRPDRKLSNYEGAVVVHAATMNLRSILEGLDSPKTDEAARTSTITAITSGYDSILKLDDLATKFAPYLKEFGVDMPEFQKQIADSQRRVVELTLLDVPANHWARQAVIDLKVQEILRGYPDGSFR